MTNEASKPEPSLFVLRRLPWIITAAALVAYFITLNRWITVESLPQVVSISGWNWQLQFFSPLSYVLTFPIRWLPDAWVPVALNAFNAICAALVLNQLARSVALLPHDRTHEERQRERGPHGLLTLSTSWLPPILACALCGLQLTFWENATAASNEMLNLLLFAFVIRCLLEHRIDQRDVWITRFALVYGLAVPNNFAMIAFAPAFLVALIWMNGFRFFQGRFISRLLLYGSLGLLLYLLLPLIHVISDQSNVGFWQVLKANMASQKSIILNFPRSTVLLLSLTSIVPVLIIGFHWRSFIGDVNRMSQIIGTALFNVVHAMFFAACVWVAFDPVFSPRIRGFGLSFLSFYYLSALAVGYYAGYFLLAACRNTVKQRQFRPSPAVQLLRKLALGVIMLTVVGVPAGLLYKNFPTISARNQPTLNKFAGVMADHLPDERAVVLSDDPRRLFIVQAWLAKTGRLDNYLLLDTSSLVHPDYHQYLARRYPEWSTYSVLGSSTNEIGPRNLISVIQDLSQKLPLYYLQPSFGYYFESFESRPRGMVYELSRYGEDHVLPQSLSEEELALNRRFWEEVDESLLGTLPSLVSKSDKAAALVSHLCSIARDYWGVALQRNSQWEEAAAHFTRALELNEDNVAAQINLEYNRQYLTGNPDGLKVPKVIEDKFGRYRTWDQVISENGPFDEPSFCFRQGMVFARGGLIRQAAVQFHRVSELNPSNVVARLRYAHALMGMRRLELADSEVKAIRALDGINPLDATNRINLIITEASLEVGRTNLAAAERIMLDGVARYPNSMFMLESAMQFYAVQGDATNAAAILEKQLQVDPGSISAMVNLGAMKIRMEDYESALPYLNQVLQADPENRIALLNRAIALLQLDRLEASRKDYLALAEIMPDSHRIHFGLAEVAYRQKSKKEAIKHYEAYLELPFINPAETQTAQERLAELKGGDADE